VYALWGAHCSLYAEKGHDFYNLCVLDDVITDGGGGMVTKKHCRHNKLCSHIENGYPLGKHRGSTPQVAHDAARQTGAALARLLKGQG
jgi:hypothetical protein